MLTLIYRSVGWYQITILKYRLYDIDVVINKTVVVRGALACFVTIVYVAIVVWGRDALGAAPRTSASRPGAGSSRRRAVPAAYATLAPALREPARIRHAGDAVRGAVGLLRPTGVDLRRPRTCCRGWPRDPREGTGAPRADVWLRIGRPIAASGARHAPAGRRGDSTQRRSSVGARPADAAGSCIRATCSARSSWRCLRTTRSTAEGGQADRRHGLSRPAWCSGTSWLDRGTAGLAQRIVAAQDDERRKLERNIHDGAQQQLVALAVKQGLLERPDRQRRPASASDRRAGSTPKRTTRSRTSATSRADLPAAARRQGTRGGPRGAGAQGSGAGHGRGRRDRPVPPGDRGDGLLLLAGGAEQHREVRGRVVRGGPAVPDERRISDSR